MYRIRIKIKKVSKEIKLKVTKKNSLFEIWYCKIINNKLK